MLQLLLIKIRHGFLGSVLFWVLFWFALLAYMGVLFLVCFLLLRLFYKVRYLLRVPGCAAARSKLFVNVGIVSVFASVLH